MSLTHDRTPAAPAGVQTGHEEGAAAHAPRHGSPGWAAVLGVPLVVAALLAVLVSAFAWPAINSEPRGLDLAVVAPEPVAAQVEGQLAATAGEDAFDVVALPDRAAAEQAVRDREVYGALVLGPQGGEALVASAASPAVAQVLTRLANGIPPQAGGPLPVTDVVPLPADDPRGVGLVAGSLPLIIGGIALGVLAAVRVRGTWPLLSTLALGSLAGGFAVVALLQGWLGSLTGDYWLTALTASLVVAAIATTVAGMHRLLGLPGVGLAAIIMVVLGNPLSGATSAPEMLPAGWGALGQWLPPGAGVTSLRDVAFFDGAGSGMAFTALGAWLAFGLVLLVLPSRRGRGA